VKNEFSNAALLVCLVAAIVMLVVARPTGRLIYNFKFVVLVVGLTWLICGCEQTHKVTKPVIYNWTRGRR
jgi:hypothetical protein